jgi:hypothetical protein
VLVELPAPRNELARYLTPRVLDLENLNLVAGNGSYPVHADSTPAAMVEEWTIMTTLSGYTKMDIEDITNLSHA